MTYVENGSRGHTWAKKGGLGPMSFPPSWAIRDFALFLRYQRLESALLRERPNLAGTTQVTEFGPMVLKVAAGEAGDIVVGLVPADGLEAVWVITHPTPARTRAWHVPDSQDAFVHALVVHIDAATGVKPEPSPWRWDEHVEGIVTNLADALDARGVAVRHVIAANRCLEGTKNHQPNLQVVSESAGDFIIADTSNGTMTISLRTGSGWLVELQQDAHRTRVDLYYLLTGAPSSLPGVAVEDIPLDRLADTLAELALSVAQPPPSRLKAPNPDEGLMSCFMHELWALGFNDVTSGSLLGDIELASDVLHIALWQKRRAVSLGDIQRHVGVASTEGKIPLMIAPTGFSREAIVFANRASAFLFEASPKDGRLIARGQRSQEISLQQIAQ